MAPTQPTLARSALCSPARAALLAAYNGDCSDAIRLLRRTRDVLHIADFQSRLAVPRAVLTRRLNTLWSTPV